MAEIQEEVHAILADSKDDWNRSQNADWSHEFSDIIELGPSSYRLIRVWQNDPNETQRPNRQPPNSLKVRWTKLMSDEEALVKITDPVERELLPGHFTLLYSSEALSCEDDRKTQKVILTSSGGGRSRFGMILNALNIDRTFRSTLYKSLPDFHCYEYGDQGYCYQLKFPNLYRGGFALAAWFNSKFKPLPQYPQTGQMNAIVLGLSDRQISEVLIKLTGTELAIVRAANKPPSVVIHPLFLITAILGQFSEEDGMFINKSIDRLHSLQQEISSDEAQRLGNISTDLNQLSSQLRGIQMGNTYMQSLAKVLLNSSYTVTERLTASEYDHCNVIDLVRHLTVAKSNMSKKDRRHPADYLSTKEQPWLPLLGQFAQIQNDLEDLGTRCEERKFDIECLQKQIDINLNVAYNLLSQEENRWNRTISRQMVEDSRAMRRIAKASKDIASASKRDSYAMKTIAILTTVFLPGTFVASLFSTSMFNFQASPLTVSHSFWVYWAVTIPLTLAVVGIWRLWLYMRARELREKELDDGDDDEKGGKED